MRTVGVDLSAEDVNTCVAVLDWHDGAAEVVELVAGASNEDVVRRAPGVAKIGIDCPFGWPAPFLEFVAAHDAGDVPVPAGRPLDWRRRMTNRTTDLVVRAETGLVPLSVSADRIAHAALRCAALLSQLSAAGVAIDRTGRTGAVAEVYPAAALLRWGLAHRGYKRRSGPDGLSRLLDALRAAAPWLDLGGYDQLCRTNDDAFDAVVAGLGARAVVLGLTPEPDAAQADLAAREGWIAVPVAGSLDRLVDPR